MGFLSRKNHFAVEGKTVLLTGGSQGMGRGLGKLLAQKGANVIIVARDVQKLQSAVEYISAAAKSSSQRFHYIAADVTSESENVRILEEATAWNNGQTPEIVWANAGAAKPGLFLDTSLETMRKQMDINYWAAVYLAHTTLKSWLYPTDAPANTTTQTPRHFIITSSSVAWCNIAGYGPYGPAKAALRSISDSLRSELNLYNGARRSTASTSTKPAPYDVKIHTVYPGSILSPGLELENQSKHPVTHLLEESDPHQTEDQVAAAAINGLERGDYMIATNWLGQLMRVSGMQGSPRDSLLWDVVGQCITSIAWLFIGPDMEGKVWKWGKTNGMPAAPKS